MSFSTSTTTKNSDENTLSWSPQTTFDCQPNCFYSVELDGQEFVYLNFIFFNLIIIVVECELMMMKDIQRKLQLISAFLDMPVVLTTAESRVTTGTVSFLFVFLFILLFSFHFLFFTSLLWFGKDVWIDTFIESDNRCFTQQGSLSAITANVNTTTTFNKVCY